MRICGDPAETETLATIDPLVSRRTGGGSVHPEATVVVAAAKPWHYWISFLLLASFILLVLALVVGYVWRVVLVRYGFRTEK